MAGGRAEIMDLATIPIQPLLTSHNPISLTILRVSLSSKSFLLLFLARRSRYCYSYCSPLPLPLTQSMRIRNPKRTASLAALPRIHS